MWTRVTKQNPCRVCGKFDWCTYNPSDGAACCMRMESKIQMGNGGWLHLANGTAPVKRVYSPPPATVSTIDWKTLFFNWRINTEDNQRDWFASKLGVKVEALEQLECCYAPEHRAWAFPMRCGQNQIVGVRLRNEQGEKWAVKGSKQGLFIPQGVPPQDTIYVCEGPTDTAAILSLGLYGIGRPFNLGGGDELKTFCRERGIRRVVFVSDNDTAGVKGVLRVETQIDLPHVTICPPCKDVRELVNMGGTREIVEMLVKQEVWKV